MTIAPVVCVLGPTTIVGPEGHVPIGGPLARGFLAVLAIESPRPVGIDRLTTLLWGERPPNGVKGALQQLASRVRRALSVAGLPSALSAVPPGYSLDVDADTVDIRLFRSLLRAAGDASRAEEPNRHLALLDEALGLWRDTALADLVELPLATLLAPALDDERWRAEEARATALLELGRPGDAVGRLVAATATAPLREELWVLLGRSLVDEGRHTDALQAVRAGSAAISATLGVPAGPELTALEEWLRLRGAERRSDSGRAPRLHPPMAVARAGVLHAALTRALDNAEEAARRAGRRSAHEEAVRHWERALELLDQVAPNDDARRLRLLLGLGDAHNAVSLDVEAQRIFGTALDTARRLGDPVGFCWAALGFCSDRIGFVSPPMHRRLLEEALDGLPDGETRLRGRVLARLATDRYWSGSCDETLELGEQALAASTAAGDVEGRLGAFYALAFGCWTPPRSERLLGVCERYLDEAIAAGDRTHELLAHRWLVPIRTELGDVRGGHAAAVAAIELADDLGLTVQQWISRVIAASQHLVEGDLDGAEHLATEALTVGSVCEPTTSFDYVSLFTWTLAWLRGSLGEIVSLVEEVAGAPGVDTARRLGLALTYGELGRLDEARSILDEVDASAADAIPADAQWYTAFAAMAEAAASCGHVRAARLAYDRLLPYADRIAVNTVTSTGPVAHQLGIAARTFGDTATAAAHLRRAVEIADRSGAPAFGARSRLALARCLSDCGQSEDVEVLIDDALDVADRLGMRGVATEARELLHDGPRPTADDDGRPSPRARISAHASRGARPQPSPS